MHMHALKLGGAKRRKVVGILVMLFLSSDFVILRLRLIAFVKSA